MNHEVCMDCTFEELSMRVTSKGFAFADKPCGCFTHHNKNEVSYCDYHYDLIMKESENKGEVKSNHDIGDESCS
jgi:hypothetical protein